MVYPVPEGKDVCARDAGAYLFQEYAGFGCGVYDRARFFGTRDRAVCLRRAFRDWDGLDRVHYRARIPAVYFMDFRKKSERGFAGEAGVSTAGAEVGNFVRADILCDTARQIRAGLQRIGVYLSEFQGSSRSSR